MMATKPPVRNWLGLSATTPVTSEATPAAKSSLLAAAVAYPQDAAIGPYCGCARLFDGQTAGLTDRYFGQVVAPGAVHARMAASRSVAEGSVPSGGALLLAWSATGGTTANEMVISDKPLEDFNWLGGFGFASAKNIITETGEKVDDSRPPGAGPGADRQFELQTLAVPYVEACYVKNVGGCSLWVSEQAADLETL